MPKPKRGFKSNLKLQALCAAALKISLPKFVEFKFSRPRAVLKFCSLPPRLNLTIALNSASSPRLNLISRPASCGVEFPPKLRKPPVHDRLSHIRGKAQVVVQIMNASEAVKAKLSRAK